MRSRRRRKQNIFSTGVFEIVLYLYFKSLWLLFNFSVRLLYKFVRLLLNSFRKLIFKTSPSKPVLRTLTEIDQMGGYEFEEFMKQVYEQLGYSVELTSKSGDQGADLILTSKEGIRTAVQVKRYSGKVSNGAVQEVVAAKGFYKCTEGIVVTNSYFTDSARQLAKANFIGLVDRYELEKLINNISQAGYHDKKTIDEDSQYTTFSEFEDLTKEPMEAVKHFNNMGIYAVSIATAEKMGTLKNLVTGAKSNTLTGLDISHLNRIQWTVGALFLFSFFGSLIDHAYLLSIFLLLESLILIPPVSQLIEEKLNFTISGALRLVLVVCFFLGISLVAPL